MAEAAAATETNAPQKHIIRDYAETILVCLIFVIFSRTFLFQQSKIPSGSMMDTLLIGDYIMVNRFVYGDAPTSLEKALLPYQAIERGDVIVFKHPRTPEVDYIKRVIGLPGERIELRDGYLYVNGERVEEPYVPDNYRRQDSKRNFGPIEIDDGHYFVMGDHRDASSDSRRWRTGWQQVPEGMIKGRALMIWYSFDEEDSTGRTASQHVRSWFEKITGFFTRTRWSRMFDVIR